jgi:CDP-diacylglycerol--glycerol-3-phosphate 3-phosphatidyltransferase
MDHLATGTVYLAIGCGDFCDGLVARLTRTESLLGKRLDISMDALGLLVASAAAVFLKRLPPAFLLVGLSYYLFQLGLTYRRFRGKILRSLADRPFGRAMAGIHMGFVGLALIPALSATLLKHAAMLFMLPLLLGFVWDWLVVTGRLGDETADRWRLLFYDPAPSLRVRQGWLFCWRVSLHGRPFLPSGRQVPWSGLYCGA